MRMVQVKWLDSMTLQYGEWADRDDHEAAMTLEEMAHHSCGYLFSEGEEALILAHTVYENEETDRAAGAVLIPRRAVLSIDELQTGGVEMSRRRKGHGRKRLSNGRFASPRKTRRRRR